MTHDELWAVCKLDVEDFEPYGKVDRDVAAEKYGAGDCSSGCRWFHELDGVAGMDFGVCGNPRSHRKGLLTYEHQGCRAFESDPHRFDDDDDDIDDAELDGLELDPRKVKRAGGRVLPDHLCAQETRHPELRVTSLCRLTKGHEGACLA